MIFYFITYYLLNERAFLNFLYYKTLTKTRFRAYVNIKKKSKPGFPKVDQKLSRGHKFKFTIDKLITLG